MRSYVRTCLVLDILLFAAMTGWIWFTSQAAAAELGMAAGARASAGLRLPSVGRPARRCHELGLQKEMDRNAGSDVR